jgi:hypothetical protein
MRNPTEDWSVRLEGEHGAVWVRCNSVIGVEALDGGGRARVILSGGMAVVVECSPDYVMTRIADPRRATEVTK